MWCRLGRRWYNCTAEYWQRRPRARCSANREPRPKASSAWGARGSQTQPNTTLSAPSPQPSARLCRWSCLQSACKDFTRCWLIPVTIQTEQPEDREALDTTIPCCYSLSVQKDRNHGHERITDHSKQIHVARVRVHTSIRLLRTTTIWSGCSRPVSGGICSKDRLD